MGAPALEAMTGDEDLSDAQFRRFAVSLLRENMTPTSTAICLALGAAGKPLTLSDIASAVPRTSKRHILRGLAHPIAMKAIARRSPPGRGRGRAARYEISPDFVERLVSHPDP